MLIRWPDDAARRDELRAAGTPRLVLVERDEAAPMPGDDLEDWVRVPADAADVQLRLSVLERRVRRLLRLDATPVLDADGVLHVGDAWVALSPVEVPLMALLIERKDAVVSRQSLTRGAWPEGVPSRNALDVHMFRLRRRISPLGVAIRTVRSRGYLLEQSA